MRKRILVRSRMSAVGWLSLLILGALVLCALFPGMIAPYPPLEVAPADAFQPPSAEHIFGTDDSGRDIFSRAVYGARDSLFIGVAATLGGVLAGVLLGVFAGGSRRRALTPVRGVSDRAIEALFAFPGLLLALLLIAIRGPGLVSVILAVAISTTPGYARMTRGGVRQVLGSGPVEAARLQGDSGTRIWAKLVLPEALRPVLVLATLGVGQAVVLAAALGFLGLGSPPPDPEWGAMLNAGRPYLTSAWWMTFFPGMMIVLVGLTTTNLGRSLERREVNG